MSAKALRAVVIGIVVAFAVAFGLSYLDSVTGNPDLFQEA
jgi:hypothetical protein